MALKQRHISENKFQILKHLKSQGMNPIIGKVKWERNSLVTANPNIRGEDIIEKCHTHKFPADAITVRYARQRDKVVSAYFHGEEKVAHGWTRVESKLIVTLPFRNQHGHHGYSWMGNSPRDMSLADIMDALFYIKEQVEEMSP